ncbi:MAG: WXG100 family type VII secretion target [Planctomycetota bacterium]
MGVSLADSETTLTRAIDDLGKRWDNTSSAWQDKAREDFEKEYLLELTASVKKAQQAMRSIHNLLREVVRECS